MTLSWWLFYLVNLFFTFLIDIVFPFSEILFSLFPKNNNPTQPTESIKIFILCIVGLFINKLISVDFDEKVDLIYINNHINGSLIS